MASTASSTASSTLQILNGPQQESDFLAIRGFQQPRSWGLLPVMSISLEQAAQNVLMGESLRDVGVAYRQELIDSMGLEEEDVTTSTFMTETMNFMNKLCRHLGDRHSHESRAGAALQVWVMRVEDYDAWDTLLSCFEPDNRETLLRRGSVLFPRTLTAHWDRSMDA